MIKPHLADVTLPVHPSWQHPITGAPVRALGFRRNGEPIWPVMGGSQPLGGPAPGAVQPPAGQPGGQPPVGQSVPGLGGVPVPVFAQPGHPAAPQQGVPGVQPQGVMPAAVQYGQPYNAGGILPQFMAPPVQPGYQYVPPAPQFSPGGFPFSAPQQVPGQPNGGPPNGGQPNGGQPGAGQPAPQHGQQPPGQQPQGGGQPNGGGDSNGAWDKPYPQGVPLEQMSAEDQVKFWKYHARQHENKLRAMGDYDQIKAQYSQLQQMTQTEWQRAVLEAENRGRSSAMEQAAGQMVAVAFQGAASSRMTPDQIHAQLGVLDPKRFVHNGQVDIAAIHSYVDTIAPPRQNGLVPVFPPGQQGQQQQLPLQQVAVGQQQGPLQPGQPGYGQQPTFGPIGQQQQLPGYGPQFGQQQQGYGQQGYGQPQVPVPGVPFPYQPAAHIAQPVVQSAGLQGLPGLAQNRHPGLPAATDFGQGPAVPGALTSAPQAGAAMAAARHGGKTRSSQLAATRGN